MGLCSHTVLSVYSFFLLSSLCYYLCNICVFTGKPTVKLSNFYFKQSHIFFRTQEEKHISNLFSLPADPPSFLPSFLCFSLLSGNLKYSRDTISLQSEELFYHSQSADLLLMGSLSFLLSKKVFILPSLIFFWICLLRYNLYTVKIHSFRQIV